MWFLYHENWSRGPAAFKPATGFPPPSAPRGTRTPGLSRGEARFREDFQEPLPANILEEFER
ncbi:MAG: hypothetical protein EA427_02405 [Spirochaetaceae bacterium]|nr:MAG: hypothetical protein EA427_02405 [Spirochaetaceae bacterium]